MSTAVRLPSMLSACLAALLLLAGCDGPESPPLEQPVKKSDPPAASPAQPAPTGPATAPGKDAAGKEAPVAPAPAPGTGPKAEAAPAPKEPPAEALATFGGGCFWCTEAVYLRLEGVLGVMPGYAGGKVANPTYQQVCEGTTGHAEVVQVKYDPRRIDYATLLKVFFKTHDPTTLNRQGYDEGTQYRSIVLFHDAEQERVARAAIAQLDAERAWPDPIVTEVVPYTTFYAAEDYHRDYFARNPSQGYCRAVVAPKVEKFEKAFASLLKR